MFTAYVVITVLAVVANTYAATVDFARPQWILDNMTRYGVPHSRLFLLGALKALGALGLLAGIGVPLIGVAASVGLALFFIGAIITVVSAHWYTHIRYPAPFLLLAVGSLALRLASF
jgi:DoxX-like family